MRNVTETCNQIIKAMNAIAMSVYMTKLDETVAQLQALQREADGLRIKLHWTEELQKATQTQNEALLAENRSLETAITQARELLSAWDRTNETQLAELTRLYAIEAGAVPALQGQINSLELEVKSLRDWNAATLAPVRCECKTCDRLAWEATQLHE